MTAPPHLTIRTLADDERAWLAAHLQLAWGATTIVSGGVVHDAARLPALLALRDGAPAGVATLHHSPTPPETELVTLDALDRGQGVGSALLQAAAADAAARGSRRLWLITTNDNLDALRFYQRRGLRLAALHRGAVDEARRLKPAIPLIGEHAIPLHDELELELDLTA